MPRPQGHAPSWPRPPGGQAPPKDTPPEPLCTNQHPFSAFIGTTFSGASPCTFVFFRTPPTTASTGASSNGTWRGPGTRGVPRFRTTNTLQPFPEDEDAGASKTSTCASVGTAVLRVGVSLRRGDADDRTPDWTCSRLCRLVCWPRPRRAQTRSINTCFWMFGVTVDVSRPA